MARIRTANPWRRWHAFSGKLPLRANFYDEHKKDTVVRSAVKRLERLGYKVTVEAA